MEIEAKIEMLANDLISEYDLDFNLKYDLIEELKSKFGNRKDFDYFTDYIYTNLEKLKTVDIKE